MTVFLSNYVSNKTNPQFFVYLEGFRNHLALIQQDKSLFLLKKALFFLRTLQKQKQSILFINNNPDLSFLIQKTAVNLNQPYSNESWIPGLLTNWRAFKPSVQSFDLCVKYFGQFLEKKQMNLPKYLKQKKKLQGLTVLKDKPSALVLFQYQGNESILKEAKMCNIPVVIFMDCPGSSLDVEYLIPLNTQSLPLIYFFCSLLCQRK